MQKRQNIKHLADKLYLTDDGIHFDQSQLWLDSKKVGPLSFLSSASLVRERYKNQVIVSEETEKFLQLYNPGLKALTCQYNRPFSIGRYTLELLPSGSALGSASLLIEADNEKLLYAPLHADTKPFLSRAAQTKQADYLIVKTHSLEHSKAHYNRKKELENFIQIVKEALNNEETPVIFTPLLHSSSELCKVLVEEQIKVKVHKYIFEVNKVYNDFGYDLGDYRLWNSKELKQGEVLILPETCGSQKILHSIKKRQFFYINNVTQHASTCHQNHTFSLPLPHVHTNINNLIKAVAPKKTFIFGPYAHKIIHSQKLAKESVELLHPFNQSTLL